jgi:hypothetical protein
MADWEREPMFNEPVGVDLLSQTTQTLPTTDRSAAAPELENRSCFVIMPFGIKKHPLPPHEDIDFDTIYHDLIKPVVEKLGIECTRSDEISKAGLIHRDMIERILKSDVVIVDITTGNANVLYELGIRHAAKRTGTIILRREGDAIPFNIGGMRVIDYQHPASSEVLDHYRSILETNIRNSLLERNIDSLVHTLIAGLNIAMPEQVLPEKTVHIWKCARASEKKICIISGDLLNIDCVDVWINPENTKMQMGRWYDDSISATIRYYGALRDDMGVVKRDTINDALRSKMGERFVTVEPGTVIATRSGRLGYSNNVKAILHVAVQHGEPARGYLTVRSYSDCVPNALETVDYLNESTFRRLYRLGSIAPLRSVVFPLFGTRGERDGREVAFNLAQRAMLYFESTPSTMVDRVYFLAYTDLDQELILSAFQRLAACGGLAFEKEE